MLLHHVAAQRKPTATPRSNFFATIREMRFKTAGERLAWAREQAGFRSARSFALERGFSVSGYNAHERAGEDGGRAFDEAAAKTYARHLKVNWAWLLTGEGEPQGKSASFLGQTVPIVGYVGAGSEAAFYGGGQGPFDYTEAPDGATRDTVAALIKGESLGTGFNGWLLFYDQRQDPPSDGIVGKLCVCGLPDGKVVVKWPALTRRGFCLCAAQSFYYIS